LLETKLKTSISDMKPTIEYSEAAIVALKGRFDYFLSCRTALIYERFPVVYGLRRD